MSDKTEKARGRAAQGHKKAFTIATVLARHLGEQCSFEVSSVEHAGKDKNGQFAAFNRQHLRWTDGPSKNKVREILTHAPAGRYFLCRDLSRRGEAHMAMEFHRITGREYDSEAMYPPEATSRLFAAHPDGERAVPREVDCNAPVGGRLLMPPASGHPGCPGPKMLLRQGVRLREPPEADLHGMPDPQRKSTPQPGMPRPRFRPLKPGLRRG